MSRLGVYSGRPAALKFGIFRKTADHGDSLISAYGQDIVVVLQKYGAFLGGANRKFMLLFLRHRNSSPGIRRTIFFSKFAKFSDAPVKIVFADQSFFIPIRKLFFVIGTIRHRKIDARFQRLRAMFYRAPIGNDYPVKTEFVAKNIV